MCNENKIADLETKLYRQQNTIRMLEQHSKETEQKLKAVMIETNMIRRELADIYSILKIMTFKKYNSCNNI